MITDYLVKVNVLLVGLCLVGVIVIVYLVFQINGLNNKIDNDIQTIETKFPKPKECPPCNTQCPDMNCPELRCPENKACPPCPSIHPDLLKTTDKENDSKTDSKTDSNSMKVQDTTQPPGCPSVQDIVSGIFPGRNPNVVDGGRYFNIDPYNTYDGLSSSNFYEQKYNFPIQKILRPDPPLRSFNIGGEDLINNSLENHNIDTSKDTKMQKTIPVAVNSNSSLNYQQANHVNDSHQYVMSESQRSKVNVSRGTTNTRDDRNIIDDDGLGHVNFLGRHSKSPDDGYEDDSDNEDDSEPDTVGGTDSASVTGSDPDTVNESEP